MTGGWRVTGVAEAGTRHVARRLPCEDAFGHWADGADGLQVLVVADGVGSARHGGEGARRAVEVVIDACQHRAPLIRRGRLDSEPRWRAFMAYLANAVRLELERASAQPPVASEDPASVDPWGESLVAPDTLGATAAPTADPFLPAPRRPGLRDYATTVLAVVVAEPWLACMQIGDGVIVARRGDGLEAVTLPAKGEYANEAPFVTDDHYIESLQVAVAGTDGLDAIALMTDGMERLAVQLATGVPHGPFFEGLFAFAADDRLSDEERHTLLARELRSEKINRLTDDDKTVLVAVRTQPVGSCDASLPDDGAVEGAVATAPSDAVAMPPPVNAGEDAEHPGATGGSDTAG
jgi:hypothetical protein